MIRNAGGEYRCVYPAGFYWVDGEFLGEVLRTLYYDTTAGPESGIYGADRLFNLVCNQVLNIHYVLN